MAGEHVSGLLNLGTLALGLALAYVGLDKFAADRDTDEQRQSEMRKVIRETIIKRLPTLLALGEGIDKLGEVFSKFEPGKNKSTTSKFNVNDDTILLRHFAGISSQEKPTFWQRLLIFWHQPPVWYFENRWDVRMAILCAAISSFNFLALTATTVLEIPFIDNESIAMLSFLILTIATLIIVGQSILLYQLTRVPNHIMSLLRKKTGGKSATELRAEADKAGRIASESLAEVISQLKDIGML